MKNTKVIVAVMSLSLLAAGCGEYSKNPVSDMDTLRANGKAEREAGPEVIRERRVEIEVVKDGTVVTVEQAKIGADSIVVSPQLDMTFSEGQSASFPITTKVLVPGVQIKLAVTGLPEGATITESKTQPGTYMLTWTPPFYTIAAGQAAKTIIAKATPQFVAGDADKIAALKALDLSKEFALTIVPTNQAPRDQALNGLSTEVAEGTLTAFNITVKVPGLDENSPEKPDLILFFDGQSTADWNNFLEMDGARHVSADPAKKSREYLGDNVWRFNRIFDTKNVNALAQVGKDGKAIDGANGTRVRFTFKVVGGRNLATPAQVFQVKINRTLPLEAPRFDLSGLKAESLKVARGQEISLGFNVSSVTSKANVKVEALQTSLPGSPKLTCKASTQGAATQECVIVWKVPCDTEDAKLKGEITLSAYAVLEGRNSQAVQHTVQVEAAAGENQLCAQATTTAEKKVETKASPTVKKTTTAKVTTTTAKTKTTTKEKK